MAKYVMAIDQGTTGTTVVIVNQEIQIVAKVNHEFPQHYPQAGWVEHDPEEIWLSVEKAISDAINKAGIESKEIIGIGITNQRETTVIWDKKTGKAIHNAIVWQDRRTADHCDELRKKGLAERFKTKTGLVLDPYFSGTKITWLLDHVEGARAKAEAGELAFGTIDSYLIWRLSGGKVHITEVSNASRTLIFDIHEMSFSDELCTHLNIPKTILPEVKSSSEVYGHTQGVKGLIDGIPIAGAAGDQQAALFGQACFEKGDAKCTYGTGAFLLVNIGNKPIISQSGILTTVGWKLGNKITYALEGSSFIAGAAVQWLRDGLGLIKDAPSIEALAMSVDDTAGVHFVPALVGLGAPHWRPHARGIITGITRGTTSAHLARATLEGIAFQIHDLVDAMVKELGASIQRFKVDGGAVANNLLLQIQADLLGFDLIRPKVIETTALGSAFLAGLATSMWKSTNEIQNAWSEDLLVRAHLDAKKRNQRIQAWHQAVEKA